jgi:hypothetical protein
MVQVKKRQSLRFVDLAIHWARCPTIRSTIMLAR